MHAGYRQHTGHAHFTIGRRHAVATTANDEVFRGSLGENPVFINGKTGRATFMRVERDGPAHYVISVSPFPADVMSWRTTRRGGGKSRAATECDITGCCGILH